MQRRQHREQAAPRDAPARLQQRAFPALCFDGGPPCSLARSATPAATGVAQSISRPQRRVKPVGGGCRSADRAMRARRPIQPSSDRQRIVPLRAIGNVDRPSLPNLPISRAPRRHVRV